MKTHQLKIWPHFLDDLEMGRRDFEIRSIKDRSFQVGDLLMLSCWDPSRNESVNRPTAYFEVAGVFHYLPGIEPGYAVLTLRKPRSPHEG